MGESIILNFLRRVPRRELEKYRKNKKLGLRPPWLCSGKLNIQVSRKNFRSNYTPDNKIVNMYQSRIQGNRIWKEVVTLGAVAGAGRARPRVTHYAALRGKCALLHLESQVAMEMAYFWFSLT
jgi:hypothetical protein